MRLEFALLWLAAMGCGGVKSLADAQLPAEAAVTARCSPTAPFGPAALFRGGDINTGARDVSAFLTADELGMYFVRSLGFSATDIYATSRSSIHDEFGSPSLVRGVNTTASEFDPSVTADGLTMYLTANASGSIDGSYDVFVATRSSPAQDFSMPSPVPDLNTSGIERGAYVVPSGKALYFSRVGISEEQIYRAALGPAGFESPVVVGLAMPSVGVPVVTPDELTIYFSSESATVEETIWVARRARVSDPFGMPTLVSELHVTGAGDEPSWISSDGCVLYFSSGRAGQAQIYVAQRGN